ncbi:hypothetical protein [Streptomyces gibsoniae]|uniref:Uncharacterized protein n=1 Tax=Streptomyces gibsoniae TaxID=3075529 RepID=A0ABU2U8H3_9ACTN|nr:hypothetical protein [Streptomyces sp. DSM 41699]MDT0469534.1 hypothetical protein [Streptomyces sp. DSM 41699]
MAADQREHDVVDEDVALGAAASRVNHLFGNRRFHRFLDHALPLRRIEDARST